LFLFVIQRAERLSEEVAETMVSSYTLILAFSLQGEGMARQMYSTPSSMNGEGMARYTYFSSQVKGEGMGPEIRERDKRFGGFAVD
jgi:hypothetical protein